MANARPLSAIGIFSVAFMALLVGHLLLKAYMPNAAIGGIGFLAIVLIFSYVLFIRRDPFGFVMVIYICSHFNYANNQGGLWNLIAFGLLGIYVVLRKPVGEFRRPDYLLFLLLGIFILWNLLGWVLKNPMPVVPRLQGVATFFGLILMFYLAGNLTLSKERFRLFLTVTFVMLIYQFLVALNQRYFIMPLNTPLLGGYSDIGTTITPATVDTPGTFTNFELFSEYAVLLASLLIPLLASSVTKRELGFGISRLATMLLICFMIPMMTSTRAAVILLVFVVVAYFLIFSTRIFSVIDRFGRQLASLFVLAMIIPVVGVYVGLGHLEKDFSNLSPTRFTVQSVISGKAINRGALTSLALARMDSESWWLGYGYGIPRSNRWAWLGVDQKEVKISGFHSLYLSLPMLYGWIGSFAFLAMVILTGGRCALTALRYRRRRTFHVVLAVGFSLFWLVFLADEYKISILRTPNYHMLFWIWLGLSNALLKTIRQDDKTRVAKPTVRRKSL